MKILMIEDNPRLAERMKRQLQKQCIVEVATSGAVGIQIASQHPYDIILLDLGLPDMPGLEVCKHIRSFGVSAPILVVSGIDTTVSRVELLDTGADDYITKPFDFPELMARINALTRRRVHTDHEPLITIGDLVINRASRTIERAGVPITLRKKEFDILEYLALNRGRVMPRQMIINHAWPSSSSPWVGSVDVHIKQLRDKVDRPFTYSLIKTSYGVGYILQVPPEDRSVP
jgi:two-component system, OmpR family, copper resistance phosphate regulon response regulator CusR